MIDDFGDAITNELVIAQVQSRGSVVVHRSPVEGADLTSWRRRLRRLARERGLRISVRKVEDLTYVLHNPDHVVTAEQLRATVAAMAVPPELAPPSRPQADSGSPPRLHVVPEE